MIFKFFWILRGILYSFFFKKFNMPSYIGKPTFIYGWRKIIVGKRVRIFPNVRLEVHGKNSLLTIDDNVAIGQNVHITTGGNLRIGKSSTILANVFITDIDHDYKEIDNHILDQKMIFKETQIGDNCFIGIGAAIQAGTILGKQCIVGANSVVKGNFPDYSVIVGSPAKVIKKYNFKTNKWERV